MGHRGGQTKHGQYESLDLAEMPLLSASDLTVSNLIPTTAAPVPAFPDLLPAQTAAPSSRLLHLSRQERYQDKFAAERLRMVDDAPEDLSMKNQPTPDDDCRVLTPEGHAVSSSALTPHAQERSPPPRYTLPGPGGYTAASMAHPVAVPVPIAPAPPSQMNLGDLAAMMSSMSNPAIPGHTMANSNAAGMSSMLSGQGLLNGVGSAPPLSLPFIVSSAANSAVMNALGRSTSALSALAAERAFYASSSEGKQQRMDDVLRRIHLGGSLDQYAAAAAAAAAKEADRIPHKRKQANPMCAAPHPLAEGSPPYQRGPVVSFQQSPASSGHGSNSMEVDVATDGLSNHHGRGHAAQPKTPEVSPDHGYKSRLSSFAEGPLSPNENDTGMANRNSIAGAGAALNGGKHPFEAVAMAAANRLWDSEDLRRAAVSVASKVPVGAMHAGAFTATPSMSQNSTASSTSESESAAAAKSAASLLAPESADVTAKVAAALSKAVFLAITDAFRHIMAQYGPERDQQTAGACGTGSGQPGGPGMRQTSDLAACPSALRNMQTNSYNAQSLSSSNPLGLNGGGVANGIRKPHDRDRMVHAPLTLRGVRKHVKPKKGRKITDMPRQPHRLRNTAGCKPGLLDTTGAFKAHGYPTMVPQGGQVGGHGAAHEQSIYAHAQGHLANQNGEQDVIMDGDEADDLLHLSNLSNYHLRKAKLMFFYVRYPQTPLLRSLHPDVTFSRPNTQQMVKWFSNFREFFYNQVDKYARQCLSDGKKPEEAVVTVDCELYKALNNHYNRFNEIEVPESFQKITEMALRLFMKAIQEKKDEEPSWKKPIYKLMQREDKTVPEYFKDQNWMKSLQVEK